MSLAAYRGTPVIVNFFASWCPDCRAELASVAAVARSANGRVAVIGVDSNESSDAAAERLLASSTPPTRSPLDADAKVATRYLVTPCRSATSSTHGAGWWASPSGHRP